MHYYPKNIGDYRRDTMNLSIIRAWCLYHFRLTIILK